MVVREFLVVHEYGTVIFHQRYSKSSQDIVLRSGLISALYNFAQEVERDSIDVLRMEKVSLLFKKRDLLIFVLFFDSTVNPEWCKQEIDILANNFFMAFPDVLWSTEIVNLSRFKSFDMDSDRILTALNRKLELILYLIEEGLITEEEYEESNFHTLGQIVGTRLLDRFHNQFSYVLGQGSELIFSQIDLLLDLLNATHVQRHGSKYTFDCAHCFLCEDRQDCFFSGVMSQIRKILNLDLETSFL
ncbi:MAG: hypothetical protein ACFFE8_12135 [Candidatus Heimdallarchaeota archaeon]